MTNIEELEHIHRQLKITNRLLDLLFVIALTLLVSGVILYATKYYHLLNSLPACQI